MCADTAELLTFLTAAMLSVHWMTTVSGFISHSYLGHLRMSVPMPDPGLLQWLDIL